MKYESFDTTDSGFRCTICLDDDRCLFASAHTLPCCHTFGAACIAELCRQSSNPTCPLCRRHLGPSYFKRLKAAEGAAATLGAVEAADTVGWLNDGLGGLL